MCVKSENFENKCTIFQIMFQIRQSAIQNKQNILLPKIIDCLERELASIKLYTVLYCTLDGAHILTVLCCCCATEYVPPNIGRS